MSFKPYKMDFMKGRRECIKNRGIYWSKGDKKWRLMMKGKRSKMREKWGFLQQSFLHEISIISEFKRETAVKIKQKA